MFGGWHSWMQDLIGTDAVSEPFARSFGLTEEGEYRAGSNDEQAKIEQSLSRNTSRLINRVSDFLPRRTNLCNQRKQ